MSSFQLHPNYSIPPSRPIENLCWTAREILAGYMEEPIEFDDQGHPNELAFDGDDEGLSIVETTPVPINPNQTVALCNMPYVFDVNDEPVPLTEPGYVALRAQPIPTLRDSVPFGMSPYDEQLVFRIPVPQLHGGAIYEGWSLSESTEIAVSEKDKLLHIGRLLLQVQYSLRNLAELNSEANEAMFLSQLPRRPIGASIEAMLRDNPDEI